jgi:uracil-DNA glycosylase family 4
MSLAAGEPVPAVPEPDRSCPLCPRLAAFREKWRAAEPSWYNAPVHMFGRDDARLLIVGLAPGLRGANRTGRPFTGDYAGDLLYRTMIAFGFATGTYAARPDDGLSLVDAAIANAVRCVPPENKPLPAEIANCRPFLAATIGALRQVEAIIALGRIAHESVLVALGHRRAAFAFAHGAEHDLPSGLRLYDSYHCSRYNTNTGVLTEAMFREVFARVRTRLATHADGADSSVVFHSGDRIA